MKLRDFKGVFKKANLKFIRAINVSEDFFIVEFEKPKDLIWRAGEHAIFTIPSKKIKGRGWRAFSLASTAKEDKVLIGTRTGQSVSEFKKTLLSLQEGDTVKIRGPFGWFVVKDTTSPLVLIGLGVGITPIRSLLMDNYISDRIINVIYSSNEAYLFKEDFDTANESDNVEVAYCDSREDAEKQIERTLNIFENEAYYYIGGSPKAIKSVKKKLREMNVKNKRIIHDPFFGY